jgi:hypothetical protein
VATFILLLVLLAALAGVFVVSENLQSEFGASNRRVPQATKRALAPPRDALSMPQLVLIVFDRASLIVRTDPGRRVISVISLPGSAYLRTPGGTTVADVLETAGAAGLVRFARDALDLQVTHVALLGPHDVAPLVDAVGGIRIKDASSFGGRPAVLDGADAQGYIDRPDPSTSRTDRERAVLGGIVSRLSSATSLSSLPGLARTFSATVATDLSPREALDLALVRLSSDRSIQCGLPERSTLEQEQSKEILQQFEGVRPTPQKQGPVFPANGCLAAPLSLSAPAPLIFVGKQVLALLPFAPDFFAPELVAVAVAFVLMLLLALLGVPQALTGMVRSGRRGGRRPRRVDEAKPESLSSASVSEALAAGAGAYTFRSNQSPVAAPAEMFHASSEIEAALERPADEIHASVRPPDEAVEEEATATPRRMEPYFQTSPRRVTPRSVSFGFKPLLRRSEKLKATVGRQLRRVTPRDMSLGTEPFLRRSEKLKAAVGRQLPHGGGFIHAEAAWVFGGTAIAIVLGFLIAHL